MTDRSAYDWSRLDPDSIMIYGSDPRFLLRGDQSPCYFHDNNQLSALDRQGIERTYPKVNTKLSLQVQRNNLTSALQTGIKDDLKNALSIQLDLTEQQLQKMP